MRAHSAALPERDFTFKHAVTHEVAYNGLLQERRRGLHARIVEELETLYAERLAEQVERLAHHALRGEVWDKAVVYSAMQDRASALLDKQRTGQLTPIALAELDEYTHIDSRVSMLKARALRSTKATA